jgi:hypothetical protein
MLTPVPTTPRPTTPLPSPPIQPQARREHVQCGALVHEVIRVWPDPVCYRLLPGRSWQEYRPWLHTHLAEKPPPDLAHHNPLHDDSNDTRAWEPRIEPLFKMVPEQIREALDPLCETICWAALKLLAAVPAALDLGRSNLSLTAMLALWAEKAPAPEAGFNEIRKKLRGPRRGLLPLIGLPASRALVRVLAKLDPFAVSVPGPDAVVELLLSEEPEVAKPLRHLHKIRADLIQVLGTPDLRGLSTYALLADDDEGAIRWGLNHSLETIRRVREEGRAPVRPARFHSRQEVEDLLLQFRRPPDRASCWNPSDFEQPFAPPVGEEVVEGHPQLRLCPVTSAEQMLARAIQDKLCIASNSSYPRAAARGDGAMYAAEWAEGRGSRWATVWLRIGRSGWRLRDARGPDNEEVPVWVWDRLEAWAEGLDPAVVEELTPAPDTPDTREPVPPVLDAHEQSSQQPVQWSCRVLELEEDAGTWLPMVPGYRDVWPSSPGWV